MGTKLARYFSEAEALGGIPAKLRLAMLTRIASTQAMTEPDSAENLRRFDQAMVRLQAERGMTAPAGSARARLARVKGASAPRGQKLKSLLGGEEWFWALLDSLHDSGIVAFARDGGCVLAWASPTLARRYGFENDEVGLADELAARVAEACGAELRRVFSDGATSDRELPARFEALSVWLDVSLSPMRDPAGKPVAAVAFLRDATQKKANEERVRASEQRLRKHNQVYLALTADKAQFLGDLTKTARRVTEAGAGTLDVARASVWLYDPAKTKIVCADLFEQKGAKHSAGAELPAADHPKYFAGLRSERTIAAADAHRHPLTAELAGAYLAPLGIGSLLDVPIWVSGEMVGVVCHEHIGPVREWAPEEESFVYLLANIFAVSLEFARGQGAGSGPSTAQ